MSSSDAFRFVELDAGNISWFPELFRSAFGKTIALERVRRKYDFSHLGRPLTGIYALDERGRPAGFTGICLFRTRYRGIEELSCHFTDSMVHPAHQRKGLYLKLLARLQELCHSSGIAFSIGFVNESSFYPVVHRMSWSVAAKMVGYRIPAASLPLRRVVRKLGMEEWYLKTAAAVLREHEMAFQEGCLDDHEDTAFIVHDAAFYEQRRTRAHFLLHIEQTPVWVKLNADLEVGVFHVRDEQRILRIVDRLRSLAASLHLTGVILQFNKGTAADRVLCRQYPSFESWPVTYKSYASRIPMELIQFQSCDNDGF